MLDIAISRHLCNRPTAAKVEPISEAGDASEKTQLRKGKIAHGKYKE